MKDAAERNNHMKKSGFTLVEIMVVVGILVVLMGIATVNIMRSRTVATEGIALANLKTLSNACQSYHLDTGVYPADLSVLANANPAYIDSSWANSGVKQKYTFVYTKVTDDSFTINANPVSNVLRGRYFYTDQDSTIWAKADGPASPNNDAPVQ
ncbi:MAG: prepilin-type N-terminal cleavage/methylation domain-containing protein [Candidatus Omnitrophica bacterium]|nr:prepilin-type N-terminal cleavage/methylation domain-containing protein [Candidatus Omnitrophota bacterium]